MVAHLNEENVFHGKTTTEGELVANGTLTIGAGGVAVGDTIDGPDNWSAAARVQVADETERDAVVAWRDANDPISATRPLLVWRANGSLTGINEITLDGENWCAEGPASGDLEMTMAAAAPYGWMLCQGQVLTDAATNYPALWAAASPLWRVGGSIRLPDLRGRVPMGAGIGTGLTLRNLGDLLGAETVILTEAQLPAHAHDFGSPEILVSGSASGGSSENGGQSLVQGTTTNRFTHQNVSFLDSLTQPAGESQGHPNIPPAAIVNFKVKI